MVAQYWQSTTSGETWVVRLDKEDGEVKGVAGPLHYRDMPRVAGDYNGVDFEDGSETCDYFQTHWDDFRKSSQSPHEDHADNDQAFREAVRDGRWGDAADLVRQFTTDDGYRDGGCDALADWLAEGIWDGTETAEAVAREWNAL